MSPFVSGGRQLQLLPSAHGGPNGRQMPSKLVSGAEIEPVPFVCWTTGSFAFDPEPDAAPRCSESRALICGHDRRLHDRQVCDDRRLALECACPDVRSECRGRGHLCSAGPFARPLCISAFRRNALDAGRLRYVGLVSGGVPLGSRSQCKSRDGNAEDDERERAPPSPALHVSPLGKVPKAGSYSEFVSGRIPIDYSVSTRHERGRGPRRRGRACLGPAATC